jgi:regulator of cell morphogenesis and NO signaling
MIQPTETLGSLARRLPAASRVFYHHQLDYCCNGQRTLAEACAQAGLDGEALIQLIESAARPDDEARRLDSLAPAALVQHILDIYHAPLRGEIARLLEMARKVESVHADKSTCPRGLAAHLAGMAAAVDDHLAKEEQILFPMILSGNLAYARMPVQVMMLEHDDHGASLRRTRELTSGLQAPPEACATWSALYLGLQQLEHDLMDHIHLENNVLFPIILQD